MEKRSRRRVYLVLSLAFVSWAMFFAELSMAQAQEGEPQPVAQPLPSAAAVIEEYSPGEYARDLAAAELVTNRIPIEEILGPLAPLALSPFFALLCLSGASMAVTSGLLPENQMLMAHPVLSNDVVFWSLVFLTLLTGIPRLMKVSKVFAQTADFLETHAGIIAYLLILAVAAQHHFLPETTPAGAETPVVISAGVFEISVEMALMLACALNIFVINSVRFFFELLVLVSPIPVVDALFEVLNKSLTAGLALLYAFNPWAATVVTLIILGFCLIAYKFVHHSVQYYRRMLTTPLLVGLGKQFWQGYDGPHAPRAAAAVAQEFGMGEVKAGLWVFPDRRVHGIPKRAKCLFISDGTTALLVRYRFLRAPLTLRFQPEEHQLNLRPGALASSFQVQGPQGGLLMRLNFSRAWNGKLHQLAEAFGCQLNEHEMMAFVRNARDFINGGLLQLGQGIARHSRATTVTTPKP